MTLSPSVPALPEHHKRFAAVYGIGKWEIIIWPYMYIPVSLISVVIIDHHMVIGAMLMNIIFNEIPNKGWNIESQIMVKLLQQLSFCSCELPNILV